MGPVVAQTHSLGLAFDGLRSHDINTNPGCDRVRDPDMVVGDSPGPDNTITSAAAWSSGTNMGTGCSLDPGIHVAFGVTSDHIDPNCVWQGPRPKQVSSSSAGSLSPWPQVAVHVT